MLWARQIRHLFLRLIHPSKTEDELDEELNGFFDVMIERGISQGMTREQAMRSARIELDSTSQVKEKVRDARFGAAIETVFRDVRHVARALRKQPAFTVVAILTLGVGIGANTAIFSVVNTFLLRPLPFPQPERLVALFERNVLNEQPQFSPGPGTFLDWQKTSKSFEQVSAIITPIVTLANRSPGGAAERVFICACSGNLFGTLQVYPILGRSFLPEEDQYGAPRVAVISYGLWQRVFGGSADAALSTIRLDGENYQVIGVMPRGFMYPSRNIDVWLPFLRSIPPAQQIRRDLHFLRVVARLRPGISPEQAS